MYVLMSSSRPWWGKQYGLINVQQQKTLVGQAVWTYQCPAVWTYQCPAAENLGGASSMDISMFRSRLLVGQAVWTFHCSGADFWWGSSMDILVSRMLVATVVRTDWQPPCMATYLGLMELKFLPMARRFRCLFLAISGTSVFKSPSKSAHTNPMNKTECREQLI